MYLNISQKGPSLQSGAWFPGKSIVVLGDYMPPTTFYGNQKEPLIVQFEFDLKRIDLGKNHQVILVVFFWVTFWVFLIINHGSVKHGCISNNSSYLSNTASFHWTMIFAAACGSIFYVTSRVNDPFWRSHIFQFGEKNHQLEPGDHFSTRFQRGDLTSVEKERQLEPNLGGDNSNILYFHHYLGKMNPIWLIFFRWVETTN